MKKLPLLLLLALAVAASAFAQSAPAGTRIKVKVGDLPTYAALLGSLDSCQKLIPSTDATKPPTVLRVPCEMSGTFRYQIASNLVRVQDQIRVYQQARTALIGSLTGGKRAIPKEDAAAIDKFALADAGLRETEIELAIDPLALADLQLDLNPIPAATIAGLNRFFVP